MILSAASTSHRSLHCTLPENARTAIVQAAFRWAFWGLLACSLIVLAGGLAQTARADGDDSSKANLQVPPQRPVKVEVSVELVEVSQIVDRDQKFEVEFYVYYTWHDPRYAFDPRREGTERKLINADDVWNPDPQLLDELDVNVRGGKVVHVYPDGKLCFSRYYRGTIAGALDLHEFPLDKHTLEVDMEESVFEADQVVFVPGEVRALNPDRAVPHGWKLANMSSEVKTSVYSKTGEQYSMLRLKLDVARDPHYYFWTIVLPLIPIVATAWSVFWMNPKEFSSQVTVGITAMLTIVAYRISIDSSLPPLSYMTRMDFFLLGCQVFVFGAFIVVVAVHVLHVLDTPETRALVTRVTLACRWMPPMLLVAASLLLTLLPARFGHWILIASIASVLLCYPPEPSQLRLWWRLLMHPESLLAAAGPAIHSTEDAGAAEPQPSVELRPNPELRSSIEMRSGLEPRRRAS